MSVFYEARSSVMLKFDIYVQCKDKMDKELRLKLQLIALCLVFQRHKSCFSEFFVLVRAVDLVYIPGTLDLKLEYPLDGTPVPCMALCTHTHTHTHT